MNQRRRLQTILDKLQSVPELTVDQVCKLLSASPATIRRDFNLLADNGKAEKTWGGIAKIENHLDGMQPLQLRKTQNITEKKSIAEAAVSLINDGDVIIIDGGTTTLELAPLIANRKIRVITNSLLVANEIHLRRSGWGGAEVFLSGGFLYPDSGLFIGPEANKNLQQYHADLAFLSVGGIDENLITNSNQLVVETERTIISQSDKTIILADKSKIGHKAMVKLCDPQEVDTLITNDGANESILKSLEQSGIKIMCK
ncbi:MAG: DeoR/GlpR family DNA-binding transcription regulator [Bacteroidota bacterium]